jgi:hypothetical protein
MEISEENYFVKKEKKDEKEFNIVNGDSFGGNSRAYILYA